MPRYWVIAPYHADRPDEWERVWQFDLENNLISIGWAKLGNISDLNEHDLQDLLDHTYPSTRRHPFRMLWDFYHSIRPADFVIARRGTKKIAAVGVVMSDAYYEEAKNAIGQKYPHSNHINVKWETSPRDKQFSSPVFSRFTVYEISEEKFRNLVDSDSRCDKQSTDGKSAYELSLHSGRRIEMPNGRDGFEELDELEEEQSSDADELEEEPQLEPMLTRRRIFTDKLDPKISDLHQDWKAGDLILNPTFQRRKVWEDARSSRLVESAVLEVPLPVFYLAENNDGTQEVIDGQQRLNAFFRFLDNDYPLTGLKELRALNHRRFRDLGQNEQKQIRNYPVRTVVFKKESDESLRFQIFERLNTGAMPLNAQELRNCIYRGPYNDLLHELSKDPDYMAIMGFKGPEKRMKDVEYVLRFAAFYHSSYLKYKTSMERFMNEEMKKFQNNILSEEKAELRTAFKTAVSLIRSMLSKNAFKRFNRGDSKTPNGCWEPKKFNASLFDILMWSMASADKNRVMAHLDTIVEALIVLMTQDEDFIDSIELSTSSPRMVTTRFDKWRMAVDKILATDPKQPRCFSRGLKESLYRANPTCSMCEQHISEIDDAAVDHIKMYWLGGETIPANARLTHRYCNWARSRRE